MRLSEGKDLSKRCTASFRRILASSAPRESEHRYTPLGANQIRLLKLHPGPPQSKICCSLHNVDLLAYDDINAESAIEGLKYFETISYVWGNSPRTVEITCSFQVRRDVNYRELTKLR